MPPPNSKAQAAKEKGNDAFKKGDYPSAIGHYTQAILEDSNDWTFPLNRAAAYLKLGKNEDAERDCIRVLTQNTTNVKALFRRAQARKALGKLTEAENDLKQAIALDPSNQSVKTELSVVKDTIWKRSASEVVHPMRRRVPIKIIEPSTDPSDGEKSASGVNSVKKSSKAVDLASSSTKTNSTSSSQASTTTTPGESTTTESTTTESISPNSRPSPSPAEHEPSFQEAKRVRNEKQANSSRVGGGIFRASGNNTIFAPRSPKNSNGSAHMEPEVQITKTHASPNWGSDIQLGTGTTTLFEFMKGWNRLSGSSVEERFRYIMAINPTSYPNMIQYSLEPPLLTGIFKTFREALDESRASAPTSPSSSALSSTSSSSSLSAYSNIASRIASVLCACLSIRRIRTVVMFLSQAERTIMKGVVDEVFRSTREIGEDHEKDREVWMGML
ncbi:hypothetical protein F5878DRAFT_630971, partial [Lentinula raphanica]